VKKINTFNIFLLGYNLYYIKISTIYGNTLVKKGSEPFLLHCLKSSKETLEQINWCSSVQKEMGNWINKFSKYKKESHLSKEDMEKLRGDVEKWYSIIRNESKYSFFIEEDKRMVIPNKLYSGASEFFSDRHNWEKLENQTKKDLNDACLCLLYDLPTPACMILFRALEGSLRNYYKLKCNIDEKINWGQILSSLKKYPNIDESLLNHLDYLRKNFRNPVEHPDISFSIREAENIFGMVIDTIEKLS